jgi:ATP-dependent Lon protease
VLAVGGIKEKLLAAARAGIRTVMLPASNEPDLAELPPNIKKRLRIVLCRHVDDVFREALPTLVTRPPAEKPAEPPGRC